MSTVQNKKRTLKWLAITLLLTGLVLGINQLFIKDLEAMQETVTSSKIYPGLNLKTTRQEADTYTLFVSQPITANEKMDEQINKWVTAERDAFQREVKASEYVLKNNNLNAHLNIQTTTTKLADKLYNLDLESYQITGGANGSTKTNPLIIDLNTNKILDLTDIFELDEANIQEIKEIVKEEAQQDEDLSAYLFEDEIEAVLENEQQWKVSIYKDIVQFSFDQYLVAAGAAGVVKVAVPMEKLLFQMNPDFIEKMGVEIPEEDTTVPEVEVEEEHSENRPQMEGKLIALTFDDGPHAEVTPRILKTLAEYKVKATFYMLGSQVDFYPTIAKQVLAEGHELGNHTMNHKDLTRLGSGQIREEIENASIEIQEATGSLPKSLRPPYGAFNDAVKDISAELNLPIAMWSVDSLDWKHKNATAINQEIMSTVHPGAIVLMHDIHTATADALPSLLASLKNEGYEFVTVSQLLEAGGQTGVGPHHKIDIE